MAVETKDRTVSIDETRESIAFLPGDIILTDYGTLRIRGNQAFLQRTGSDKTIRMGIGHPVDKSTGERRESLYAHLVPTRPDQEISNEY